MGDGEAVAAGRTGTAVGGGTGASGGAGAGGGVASVTGVGVSGARPKPPASRGFRGSCAKRIAARASGTTAAAHAARDKVTREL
jgi:hypothetical protein